MKKNLQYSILLFVSILLLGFSARSQNSTAWFSYSGQASISGEFYNLTATGGEVRPRRPEQMLRFSASGSIIIKGINMPFSMMFSNVQRNINTPFPTNQNLIDFVINPVNSIGISPTFKFGKILIGTTVPKFMSYTSGDIRSFGFGLDALFSKKWRVAFHGGNAQIPVPQNIPLGLPGAYTRRVYTGKIGYGEDTGTHLHVGMMKAKDLTASVPETLAQIAPNENIVISISGRYKYKELYYIESEWARSGITENSLASGFENKKGLIQSLLPVNATSRLGTAFKAAIGKQGKLFSARIYYDYMTEGFRTLGYPFLQPDQINYRFEPKLNLMEGKLNLSGAIGQRINNVSGLKSSKTIQVTSMLNVNWQATEKLSIAANYNNFGLRNTIRNDTLKVENVNKSLSVTPTYMIPTANYTHVITATASFDAFDDYNVLTGTQNKNNSTTLLGSYILTFSQKPLTVDVTTMQFANQMPTQKIRMRSVTAGINYQYFDKKMATTFKLTLMENKLNDDEAATQVMTQVNYKYNVVKKLVFVANASLNLFKFGSEKPDVRFRESLLTTSLTYTLK